jgi:predicted RNA binding protein with dsRBD fold (UPF0201 family)
MTTSLNNVGAETFWTIGPAERTGTVGFPVAIKTLGSILVNWTTFAEMSMLKWVTPSTKQPGW